MILHQLPPLPITQKHKWLTKLSLIIAGITIISGLGQLLAAPFVLKMVGAAPDKTSAHFFAIIGMFMFLFGGLLWQTIISQRKEPNPVFWCALQKFGAAIAVGLGVYHTVFGSLALSVAAFDLLSGILLIIYWRHLESRFL